MSAFGTTSTAFNTTSPANATLTSNPTNTGSLNSSGAIAAALLDALNTIEQTVTASMIGPDGKTDPTAVYMHLPMGYPIDPTMFSNAWTPAGGSDGSSMNDDGTFVKSTPAAATATSAAPVAGSGTGPSGAIYPPPSAGATATTELQTSIQNAFYTSQLVDNMLYVTNNGVAANWPDRTVSIEYYGVLEGIQPESADPPSAEVAAAVAAAQKFLYLEDANGNFIGYTPIYAQYIRNREAWTNAIAAQAVAYANAMSNPAAGQAWPVEAATYANAVTQALNDLNGMGREQVEAALNTIASEGQNAVAALVALGKSLYGSYQVQLAGSISAGVQWSYISPAQWWNSADESFGVQKLTASSSNYYTTTSGGASTFASGWQAAAASQYSGSAGVNVGFAAANASGSSANASDAAANAARQSGFKTYADRSSSVTMTFEFFIATIYRPWFLGDLLNIQGWYLVGQKAESISDGTIDGQLNDPTKTPKLLPMTPKAFVIMRNVQITADDWGEAGAAFQSAQQSASSSDQSSSSAMGISAHYLFYNASANAAHQNSSSAFGNSTSANTWSYAASGETGGTLSINASQIIGWVGEIQPKAPLIDDPTLASSSSSSSSSSSAVASTGPTMPPLGPTSPPTPGAPPPAASN